MGWLAVGGVIVLWLVWRNRRAAQHGYALYTIRGEKRYVFEFRGHLMDDSVYFAVKADDFDEAKYLVAKAAEMYAEEIGIQGFRCYPSSHVPPNNVRYVG